MVSDVKRVMVPLPTTSLDGILGVGEQCIRQYLRQLSRGLIDLSA